MYDYKFRQDEFSYSKPKRRWHKLAIAMVAMLLLGGLVYAFSKLDLNLMGTEPDKGTDSDVIPLQIPPHSDSPQGSHPVRQAPTQPGLGIQTEAFVRALHTIDEDTETASV